MGLRRRSGSCGYPPHPAFRRRVASPARRKRPCSCACAKTSFHRMASPPPPGPVLFDLDGTLIDSIGLILQSAQFAFDKCGLSCPTDAEWLVGVGRPLPVMFSHFAPGHEPDLIAAYREFQMANHDRLVTVYPGVPEMLAELAAQ